jgi:hypothetical protein
MPHAGMWFMATNWTLSSNDGFRPARSPWGAFPIKWANESTAQSFRYGNLIENDLDASTAAGRLAIATVSGSTVTSTSIVGVAAQPASSNVNTKLGYYPADPNIEFWGRTIRGVLDSSCVFNSYGIAYDSTLAIHIVDIGNAVSTSQRVVVTELVDGIGDSGGAVLFTFGHYNSTLQAFHGRGRS